MKMIGRLRALVARHRLATSVAGTVGLALVVFVLVWFQPQKLFLDQKVDEALPGVIGSPAAASPVPAASITASPGVPVPSPQPARVAELASGTFRSLEHDTTGRAVILRLPDGSAVLRFENLNTSNGPDLHVYLSEIRASGDWHVYGTRYVDLGKLKGNIGDQNYQLPKDIDLTKFKSAVVWCKRFAVGFGVAALPQLASL
jgi:hypothetical protein